jgi:hypothetical protein
LKLGLFAIRGHLPNADKVFCGRSIVNSDRSINISLTIDRQLVHVTPARPLTKDADLSIAIKFPDSFEIAEVNDAGGIDNDSPRRVGERRRNDECREN